MNMLGKYESVLILKTKTKIEELEWLVNNIKEIAKIGNIKSIDFIGKRPLAYSIQRQTEGVYLVIDLQAERETIAEIERFYRLNENILKFIDIKILDWSDIDRYNFEKNVNVFNYYNNKI